MANRRNSEALQRAGKRRRGERFLLSYQAERGCLYAWCDVRPQDGVGGGEDDYYYYYLTGRLTAKKRKRRQKRQGRSGHPALTGLAAAHRTRACRGGDGASGTAFALGIASSRRLLVFLQVIQLHCLRFLFLTPGWLDRCTSQTAIGRVACFPAPVAMNNKKSVVAQY